MYDDQANDNLTNERNNLPASKGLTVASFIQSCPAPCGIWSDDNRAGRDYADRFVDRQIKNSNPTELNYVVLRLMATGGEGIRVGFLHRLCERITI